MALGVGTTAISRGSTGFDIESPTRECWAVIGFVMDSGWVTWTSAGEGRVVQLRCGPCVRPLMHVTSEDQQNVAPRQNPEP